MASERVKKQENLIDLSSDDSEEEYSWISYFCSLKGNEFYCEVDPEYIHDSFNLTGLSAQVPYYEFALDIVLDVESNDDIMGDEHQETIESEAEILYGLIHARYILTKKGLHAMYEKYRLTEFGRCPRVYCNGQAVLPIGVFDAPNKQAVKVFCPRCEDVYHPRSARVENVDGAFFGTTFAHLFFLEFPDLKPVTSLGSYIPSVFGFPLHESSHALSIQAKTRERECDSLKQDNITEMIRK